MASLQEQVIEEFSSPLTQKLYCEKADSGLWGSEEVLIRNYFQPGSRVLDLGCGMGRVTMPLQRMGYQVTGIDITPLMIENAEKISGAKKLKIPYLIMDARKLKYKDASFDNIIFPFNGWSQIPNKNERFKVLREASRALKPGGYYIFTTTSRSLRMWFFWLKQIIKFGILRPLGMRTVGIDFGDNFFHREYAGERSRQKQFMNFSSRSFVKKQIKAAGFRLIQSGYCDDISTESVPHWPDLPCAASPTFYVCQKPNTTK
ncbi:MAG: class I SAM-dependent methyltransferase [Patescibacteria group bacterium]